MGLLAAIALTLIVQPQTAPAQASSTQGRYTRAQATPDGIGKFYFGREIAQVMGHQAAWWLDRPERESEEAPSSLLKSIGLKPGLVVADIGAGSGYLSFPMARQVSPGGKVLAVEIQREMLDIIRAKAKRNGVKNVETVLGTVTDTRIPDSSADLMILVDVYHEFDHPYEMVASMVKGLKPGGKLIFVEYRGEDPWVPIKPLHKLTEAQVKKELAQFPLKFEKNLGILPRQHILIFSKE